MTEVSQRLPALSTWMRREVSVGQEKNEGNSNPGRNPYLNYAYPTPVTNFSPENNILTKSNTEYSLEEVSDESLVECQNMEILCDVRTNYVESNCEISTRDVSDLLVNASRCLTPGILKRCIPFQDTLLSESRIYSQGIEDHNQSNQMFTATEEITEANCTEIRQENNEFLPAVNLGDNAQRCTISQSFLTEQQVTKNEAKYDYEVNQWNDLNKEKDEDISLELLNWEQDIISLTGNDFNNPENWEFNFDESDIAGSSAMSDEYGDESEYRESSKQSAGSSRRIPPHQRLAANRRERRRMTIINKAFERLRKHVPMLSRDRKLSKVDTLRAAAEYIDFMDRLLTCDTTAEKTSSQQTEKVIVYHKVPQDNTTSSNVHMMDCYIVGHSLSWSRSSKSRENSPSRDFTNVQGKDNKTDGKVQNVDFRQRRIIAPVWTPEFPASNNEGTLSKRRHNKKNKVKPLDVSLEQYFENIATKTSDVAKQLPSCRTKNNSSEKITYFAENVNFTDGHTTDGDYRPLGTADNETLQDSISITDQLQREYDDQTAINSILAYEQQLTDECMMSSLLNNNYGNDCYDANNTNSEETISFRNTNINQEQTVPYLYTSPTDISARTSDQYFTVPSDLNFIFSGENLNISESNCRV